LTFHPAGVACVGSGIDRQRTGVTNETVKWQLFGAASLFSAAAEASVSRLVRLSAKREFASYFDASTNHRRRRHGNR
jgi:hypothetical protein